MSLKKPSSLANQLTYYLLKVWLGFTFVFGLIILTSVHQLHEKLIESQLEASFANVSATLIDPILLKEYGRIERHLENLVSEKQLSYIALFFPEDSAAMIMGRLDNDSPLLTHNITLDDEHLATLSIQAEHPLKMPYALAFWLMISIVLFTIMSFMGLKKRLVSDFVKPIEQLTEQTLNNQMPSVEAYPSLEVANLATLLTLLLKDRQNAIENIQNLAQQQNETMGKLCADNRLATIGQLTAEVAHELNTPLSNILVYSQWLQTNPHESEQALKTIEEQARKAGQIVQRILVQTRVPVIENQRINLSQVCHDFVKLMQPIAQRKQSKLMIKSPKQPIWVKANATAIEQILLNLTNNSLYANASLIELTLIDAQGTRLTVCDNGSGISETMQQQLFNAFSTDKPAGQGTGLGLFICRKLAQNMNAELNYLPSKQGCCFQLSFTTQANTSCES
ncbi:MAG: HAMP domain-containing histidine kinase [Gammaproteobacteria bacterium]|nr:HAMP domain-containing histidine kinase [Gammaproteobacteria bacterium]